MLIIFCNSFVVCSPMYSYPSKSCYFWLLFWLMLCIAEINRELITFLLSTRPVLIINSPFTNWCLQEREREVRRGEVRRKGGRGKEGEREVRRKGGRGKEGEREGGRGRDKEEGRER